MSFVFSHGRRVQSAAAIDVKNLNCFFDYTCDKAVDVLEFAYCNTYLLRPNENFFGGYILTVKLQSYQLKSDNNVHHDIQHWPLNQENLLSLQTLQEAIEHACRHNEASPTPYVVLMDAQMSDSSDTEMSNANTGYCNNRC